jgi:predicted RNase H-like HicB family nuclease
MLTEYIQAAMRHATYEILEDDGTFFGRIPGLEGVWANEETLEASREELQSALEDWIVFSLVNGFEVPPVDGIELVRTRVG